MNPNRMEKKLSFVGDVACYLALSCVALAFTAERLRATKAELLFSGATVVFGAVLVLSEIARSFLRYRYSDKE